MICTTCEHKYMTPLLTPLYSLQGQVLIHHQDVTRHFFLFQNSEKAKQARP